MQTASVDLRAHLQKLLSDAVARTAPDVDPTVGIERPKQAQHGDYATSVALQIAKSLRANPRDVAGRILTALPASPWVESTEIAGAGFINIRLTPAARQTIVHRIHAEKERFGTAALTRAVLLGHDHGVAMPTLPD